MSPSPPSPIVISEADEDWANEIEPPSPPHPSLASLLPSNAALVLGAQRLRLWLTLGTWSSDPNLQSLRFGSDPNQRRREYERFLRLHQERHEDFLPEISLRIRDDGDGVNLHPTFTAAVIEEEMRRIEAANAGNNAS